jgi:FdhD protein
LDYWPFPKLAERLKLRKAGAGPVVAADLVSRAVTQLNVVADTFRKTGAVHVAALYDANGGLLALAEDVGRHNAVDKVIGIRALTHSGFTRCFLALGGRLTGDIVLKAARVGVPIGASQAAAITSGIDVATHCAITLIGFTRGQHMNIYTHPERITYEA